MPSKKFADGAEIYQHCRNIGKHFGLYDGAIFSTQVRDLSWDEEIKRWRISTNRGDDIRARFVVLASGSFNRPKLPGIPGIQEFSGHIFHSSRWDYDYTGGDAYRRAGQARRQEGRADRHRCHRRPVGALPGPGCRAPLRVPAHPVDGRRAQQHAHRSGMGQVRCSPAGRRSGSATSTPGRSRAWRLASPTYVCDFWTELGRNTAARVLGLPDPASMTPEQFMGLREEEDYKVMERLRRRIGSLVDDPDTAEALKPYYRFLCKRPCSNDDYLPTFNRPNVTLVDVSESKGVEKAHREGHRRGRRGIRGRLHHLRQRFRDHHRDQPPLRDRRRSTVGTACRSTTIGPTATRPCTA